MKWTVVESTLSEIMMLQPIYIETPTVYKHQLYPSLFLRAPIIVKRGGRRRILAELKKSRNFMFNRQAERPP